MKSNEMIHCTIKILNSKDNNEILSGVSYYFTIKRNTLVKDLFSEFIKNFIDQEEIKQYNLYTNQQK